jgi:hypothetical protein
MRAPPWCALVLAFAPATAPAQLPTRNWDPRSRVFITDLSRVHAVAATQSLVFAATPQALAIYDRGFRTLRETVGVLDGYPDAPVTAMAADPTDDAVWLLGRGAWALYRPFGRAWDRGTLPGEAQQAVLDASDPARGVYARVSGRWYFISKVGGIAVPATDLPPVGRRLGSLSAAELRQRAPGFDLVRLRIERDELLRNWPVTSAAAGPMQGDLFIGTDGNGMFRLDPASHLVERYPVGLLGSNVGAVAVLGEVVCAGSDDRLGTRRRGISCMRQDLGAPVYYEQGQGLAAFPGTEIRRLALGAGVIWAATDQGLARLERQGRRLELLQGAADLPSDDVLALLALPQGVWAGTTLGLAFVSDTGRRMVSDPAGVSAGVLALAQLGDTLWIASTSGVLARSADPASSGALGSLRVAGRDNRETALAVAAGRAGILAATAARLIWIAGDSAVWLAGPPAQVGRVRVIVADEDGFWIGGSAGLGLFRPATGWIVVLGAGDVASEPRDLAVSHRYVWVATGRGLVRFEKRELVP